MTREDACTSAAEKKWDLSGAAAPPFYHARSAARSTGAPRSARPLRTSRPPRSARPPWSARSPLPKLGFGLQQLPPPGQRQRQVNLGARPANFGARPAPGQLRRSEGRGLHRAPAPQSTPAPRSSPLDHHQGKAPAIIIKAPAIIKAPLYL